MNNTPIRRDLLTIAILRPLTGMLLGLMMLCYGDQFSQLIPRGALDKYIIHVIAGLIAIPVFIIGYLWHRGYPPKRLLPVSVALSLFTFTLLPASIGGSIGVIEQLICLFGAALLVWSLSHFPLFQKPASWLMMAARKIQRLPAAIY